MKKRLPVGVGALIALALVAYGIFYGTWAGYREERQTVMELFAAENGLRDVLHYRAADGLNLCVVARRHLGAENEAVQALEAAARALQSAEEPEACILGDESMNPLIRTLIGELTETDSYQASERDRRYLDMLIADLNSLSAGAAATGCSEAARQFNSRLETPLLGDLAAWLGVEPFPLYEGHSPIPSVN